MPYIRTTPPSKPNGKTAGEISLINFINSLPKSVIKVIKPLKSIAPFDTDVHDPNFNKTIESLTTIYV